MVAYAEEDDEIISSIVVTGMGEELPNGQASAAAAQRLRQPCTAAGGAECRPVRRWPVMVSTALCALRRCPSVLTLLQRRFLIEQTEWMRNTEYEIEVSATNNFGQSDNSSDWVLYTPL